MLFLLCSNVWFQKIFIPHPPMEDSLICTPPPTPRVFLSRGSLMTPPSPQELSTNLGMFFFSVPLTALILSRDALLIGYAFYLRFKSLPSPVSMICSSQPHVAYKARNICHMCILHCCITFKCVKGFCGFYWSNKTDEMAINRLGDHTRKEKYRT